MKRWHLTLFATVAVLGLQACDIEPERTAMTPPQSSPDDAVLRQQQAEAAPPLAATPLPPGAAPSDTAAMGAPPAAGTGMLPPPVAMGAPQPSAPIDAAPGGEGTAAMTQMWRHQQPDDAASEGAQSREQPRQEEEKVSSALPAVRNPGDPQGARLLAQRQLVVPVAGIAPASLADHYEQGRGGRSHEAIDILAPAGTPVVAVDDGRIAKLFTSKPGGLTVYQFDATERLAYYYAHLQGYARGLREGMDVQRGELIGYVGTSGNARGTPHLHFAVFRLDAPPKWWKGAPVNPYPALSRAQATVQVASR